jgi:hypothetical protein
LTIIWQFGILSRNFKQVGVVPPWGVANRGDHNQQQLQASMLVGDSPSNAEVGNAEHDPAVMNSISARASLSPLPRNLFDFWQELIEGIGGRKPARHFSFSEQGRVKHKFHRCKILWDLISRLTRQGYTANPAIDSIYNVYLQQNSVTNIKNGVKRDLKNGTLIPNLQF